MQKTGPVAIMTEFRVLLTGATGFVGRYVAADLLRHGYAVRAVVRNAAAAALPADVEIIAAADLTPDFAWMAALRDVDCVVHALGLAHADGRHADEQYDLVNTQLTLSLARAAAAASVRRLVFLSSIRAQTGFSADAPLSESDEPQPTDGYGRSKLAAEKGLAGLDIDWIALRPVLVYGPGVKANMAALMRLARLPLPLPLAGLKATRSILALENLAAAIIFAMKPRCPARRPYIVADPDALSVAQMIAAMRAGLGRKPGLFSVPESILAGIAGILGQSGRFEKLSAGFVAPPTALIAAGWMPRVRSEAALAQLMAGCAGA
jgi:nucleoside-diphosphate-sugar epimerase